MNSEIQRWANHQLGDGQILAAQRASTLLYTYLCSLGQQGNGVVLPSVACQVLPQVVELAGYRPIFSDIESGSFVMGRKSLEAAISSSPVPISACIAVHTFGHLVDLESISDLCLDYGIKLIEDACQFSWACPRHSPADAILLSFGRTKPIDIGGGGALHIRDVHMFKEVAASLNNMPPKPTVTETAEVEYGREYYDIRRRSRGNNSLRVEVLGLTSRYRDLILTGATTPNWTELPTRLLGQPADARLRVERSAQFNHLLRASTVDLPVLPLGSIPWRYTFLVKEARDRDPLIRQLRAAVSHASTWYPSLSLDYQQHSSSTPVSNDFEQRVVNLWLAEGVTEDYVRSAAGVVNTYMEDSA